MLLYSSQCHRQRRSPRSTMLSLFHLPSPCGPASWSASGPSGPCLILPALCFPIGAGLADISSDLDGTSHPHRRPPLIIQNTAAAAVRLISAPSAPCRTSERPCPPPPSRRPPPPPPAPVFPTDSTDKDNGQRWISAARQATFRCKRADGKMSDAARRRPGQDCAVRSATVCDHALTRPDPPEPASRAPALQPCRLRPCVGMSSRAPENCTLRRRPMNIAELGWVRLESRLGRRCLCAIPGPGSRDTRSAGTVRSRGVCPPGRVRRRPVGPSAPAAVRRRPVATSFAQPGRG